MNTKSNSLSVLAHAILFLFFFQLITDFVRGIYAFGLLGTDIPAEIVAVVLLLAPFLLIVSRNGWPRWLLLLIGEGILLSRMVEILLDTRGRMLLSGLGTFLFLLLFPALLYENGRRQNKNSGLILGAGLTLGLALSITLRSLNGSLDLSIVGWGRAIGWLLGLALALFLPRMILPANDPAEPAAGLSSPKANLARVTGLSLGIMSVFILLYFAFTSPTVVARWTEANYFLVTTLSIVVLALFAWSFTAGRRFMSRLPVRAVVVATAVFTLALALTLRLGQPSFPDVATAYPLPGPATTIWSQAALFLTLLLSPIILLDFIRLASEIVELRPSLRTLGLAFGIAAIFLLLMIFAHVFTTTYAYIPVIGPFFRDKYWLVYLVAGLVLTLSTLLLGQETADRLFKTAETNPQHSFPLAMLLLGLVTIIGVPATMARPPKTTGTNSLRILNYNIQQGYGADGQFSLDEQLALMKEVNADIIGLQETDSARIAGGNTDIVRYLASRLDMYTYYGPTPIAGTFGNALLSKYPIQNPETYFLYSEGEQVAVIEAQITVGRQTFTICVNHFGNTDDPVLPTQAEQFLQLCGSRPNLVTPGDYNLSREEPDPSLYLSVSEILDNTWQQSGKPWPERKIEHIFISPGLEICDTGYIDSPASDHPAEWAEICWDN